MWVLIAMAYAMLFIAPMAAAQEEDDVDGETNIAMGMWRAVLKLPGGDLPFVFELSDSDSIYTADLINGPDRVHVEDVRVGKNHLTLFLTAFNSRITAQLEHKMLKGTLRLTKRGGTYQVIPFLAWHGQTFRFFETAREPEIELSGRWAVTFLDEDGEEAEAIGEFTQVGSRLYGTFLTPTGDYRYLEGDVRDRKLYLSCFDGGHAFLFKGRQIYDGSLEGDFWSGTAWHEEWTAVRDDDATPPDPFTQTYIRPGYEGVEFEFPDLDGTAVAFPSEEFEGKVVIVTISGSWCPNCHDEAEFLSEFYNEGGYENLEIIALMYEHVREREPSVTQVRRFRERYDIQFRTLLAGYSDKREAAETLPMLNHILAYPTTIFIGKDGHVRRIHTGFTGPGTGEHFEAFKEEFITYVEGLLEE